MRRPPVRSSATAKSSSHFFKIIHSAVIEGGCLRIPRKFTEKFLKGISDVAILNVPGGKVWRVKLKKERDGLWLHKGLKEFIDFYSICEGHLLVFRYDGFSQFNVLIFDTSATEIVYPCNSSDSVKCKQDVSVEIVDVVPCLNRATPMQQVVLGKFEKQGTSLKHKPQLEQPWKENRGTKSVNFGSRHHKKKDSYRSYIKKSSDAKREVSVDIMAVANRESSSMIHTTIGSRRKEREKLVRTARRLKLGQPHAAVTLTPTYVNRGFVYFPRLFSRTFFSNELKRSALRVKKRAHLSRADGKTWPVDLVFHAGRVCLLGGWRAFVRENNLSEGNFCFFELVKKGHIIDLKVSTSRPRN